MSQIDVYKEWLGIPETERPPNHYQLLRLVQFEDDAEKIRAHYKKLNGHVRKYASGKYTNESQALLNELAKAMLCLTDHERKVEYDQSLGREVQAVDDRDLTLGQLLVRDGVLTKDQLREVESHAERTGLTVRDAVIQMKLTDADTAARALARERGLPFVDLEDLAPDDQILDQVPRSTVRHYKVIPLFVDGDCVLVAGVDVPPHELEDELRMRFGMPIRAVVTTPTAINKAISQHYAPGMREDAKSVAKPKSGGAAKPKAAKKKEPSTQDPKERKLIGIMLICWSLIGLSMFDMWVTAGFLPSFLSATPFVATILIEPIIAYVVYDKYFR